MELPRPLNDWAKMHDGVPGISVRQHLLTVACVAEVLLRCYPHLCDRCHIAPSAILFLAASHDVGKLSLDFLQKSSVWLERQGLVEKAVQQGWKTVHTRPHPRISCDSLQKFLIDNRLAHRKSAACWGAVVGAHHGQISKWYSSAPPVFKETDRLLEEDRQTCLGELWEYFGKPALPDIQDKDDPSLWCVAGLVTLADWIGSDERFFPLDTMLREVALRQRATEAVASIGLGLPPIARGLSFADIFSGRSPYPLTVRMAIWEPYAASSAAAMSSPGQAAPGRMAVPDLENVASCICSMPIGKKFPGGSAALCVMRAARISPSITPCWRKILRNGREPGKYGPRLSGLP